MSELGSNLQSNSTIGGAPLASAQGASSDGFTDTKNNSMGKNFEPKLSVAQAQNTGYSEQGAISVGSPTIPTATPPTNPIPTTIPSGTPISNTPSTNPVIGEAITKKDNTNKKKLLIGSLVFIWIAVGAYYFLGGSLSIDSLQGNLMGADLKYSSSIDEVDTLKDDGLENTINNQMESLVLDTIPITLSTPTDNIDDMFLKGTPNITNTQNTQLVSPVQTQQAKQAIYDRDNDGVSDDVEKLFGTNADKADTDDDGLNDMQEMQVYNTDPLKPDTDGDGKSDLEEILAGTDPKNSHE